MGILSVIHFKVFWIEWREKGKVLYLKLSDITRRFYMEWENDKDNDVTEKSSVEDVNTWNKDNNEKEKNMVHSTICQ